MPKFARRQATVKEMLWIIYFNLRIRWMVYFVYERPEIFELLVNLLT